MINYILAALSDLALDNDFLSADLPEAADTVLEELSMISKMYFGWVRSVWHLITSNWILSLEFALTLLSLAVWIIRRIMNIKP